MTVAQMIKNLLAMQDSRVRSLGQEDHLEKGLATHPSILAGEFHGQAMGLQRVRLTEHLSLVHS